MRTAIPIAVSILLAAGCSSVRRAGFVRDGGGGIDLMGGAPDLALAHGCQPGEPPSCDGDFAVKTCLPDGRGYTSAACPDGSGCQNGACLCTPGALSCSGPDVQRCGADQMFHLDHACAMGTHCVAGRCSDPVCADELISSNPHALPVDGWPRFRHDNRNTGATLVQLAAMPTVKWKTFIGGTSLENQGGLASGPVVNQNNLVFVGAGELDGTGGSFYALDGMGHKIYSFAAQRGFGLSTPAVRNDGTAYFSTTSSYLYAVDPQGHAPWSYVTGMQADSDPIVTHDGILIYSSDDGSLYALDGNGKLIWKSDPRIGPGEVDGGLAESCDGRIFAAGKNGWFSLDAATGKPLWSFPAMGQRAALVSSPVVAADGTMYGFDSGGLGYAIDPKGKLLWLKTFGPSGAGSSAALTGGVLYVVLDDGALHAIDAATGAVKWVQSVNNAAALYLNAGPIVDGNQRIYFNSTDGYVYAFDTAGNQLWKIPTSGTTANMAWSGTMAIGKDGTLYVPGNDGNLYALQ